MDPLQQLLIILQPLLPLLPGLNVLGQARLVVLNAGSQCPELDGYVRDTIIRDNLDKLF